MVQNAQNVSNARPGAAGALYSGLETGIELPTDAVAPIDEFDLRSYGFLSDEGITNSFDIDSESVEAFGGDEVLSMRTSYAETFNQAFLEQNENTMRALHGEDHVMTTDEGLIVVHSSQDLPYTPWVYELLLTNNRVKRIVIFEAKPADFEDREYDHSEATDMGFELRCRPVTRTINGKSFHGVTAVEYIANINGSGNGSENGNDSGDGSDSGDDSGN